MGNSLCVHAELSTSENIYQYSLSRIAQRVFGYNAKTPFNFAYVGTENFASNNCAVNYDIYLLPIADLGLTAGDTLVCCNDNQWWSSGWLYNIYCFDENMQYTNKASNYAARRLPRSIKLTEDIKFIGMRVIFGGYANNLAFDKSDIPLNEFQLYKNTVGAENAVDYISVWDEMIHYDDHFEIRQKMFGHNIEWDYAETDNCSNSLEYRLDYYDIYDVDLFKTADGKYIAAHDSAYGFSNMTLAEIRQKYPSIMTFEEVLEYAFKNNKEIFISTSNGEIRALIEKYQMTDSVFYENAFNINAPNVNSKNNGHSAIQWSCIDSRNFNEEYIKGWQEIYSRVSLCTGGYSSIEHFTDEQIDWCVDNGVEIGFAFFGGVVTDYRSNSLSVTAPYHFFRTHNKSVMNKLSYFMVDNEEYSESLIKAACRYAYGMNTDVYETVPDIDVTNFKVSSVSVSLESNITMNYKVLKKDAAGFEKLYIEFIRNGKTVIVSDYTEQNEYLVFSYKDIAPQAMKDTVTAVLYGERNNITYSSEPFDFSVSEYAYGMLERCGGSPYEKLRTLLVDLLNYGSAAQNYQNYKTDDLINSELTDEQKSWVSDQNPTFKNVLNSEYETVENPPVVWNSVGLTLNHSVAVRYTFSAESIENLQLLVKCGSMQRSYSKEDIADNGDSTYTFVFNDLYANKMQDDILVTAFIGDDAVSNTMCYSVESYAQQVQQDMPDTALNKLTDAMIRYGISASDYAG